eukprot:CAMPEP_0195526112 /NCGR_PEP_ID=MMETSP0794_2-20130614/26985_1 /TAXON_ID=515487 /ORGANISM="Stephanopyxis turris, Strain CCMP 815" /LENGTH=492 /DNA_ID=CAMNT_0040656729 /DNA_START=117 /DNA_END=1595 /DNA_ORIENTATION=+
MSFVVIILLPLAVLVAHRESSLVSAWAAKSNNPQLLRNDFDKNRSTNEKDILRGATEQQRHDDKHKSTTSNMEDRGGNGVLHLCFLVHGHRGRSSDLSYLKSIVENTADQHDSIHLGESFVVHSSQCNEDKTHDGIVTGGERLVTEILDVIRHEVTDMEGRLSYGRRVEDVTISLVGNSLGGLYARYAISRLRDIMRVVDGDDDDNDGTDMMWIDRRMHFNVFCSTATPHLGVASHTYIPVPRAAEKRIAEAMGPTGRDLFRFSDLVRNMGTNPYFLEALGTFRKRIAYANAFHTDFPVPSSTAAFLNPYSNSPHRFVDDESVNNSTNKHDNYPYAANIVAKVHTETIPTSSSSSPTNDDDCHHNDDDMVRMCKSLDALGWKKVFVDLRQNIPFSVPLQLPLLSTTASNSTSMEHKITDLRNRKVVESRDLHQTISKADRKLSLPIGHNMIVAFSRSTFSSYVNRAGRPVMDDLAKELVEDILLWRMEKTPA